MYIKRQLSDIFKKAMMQFPAVLVTGPRQAGKTTFLQNELENGIAYVTFDDPLERSFAQTDPNGFLDRFGDRAVVLDEIQYAPELLSPLKLRIDRQQQNGRWFLTGSQHFHLMRDVQETLSGRIAILDMLPFSIGELHGSIPLTLEGLIWNGCYPELALYPEKRDLWLRSYLQTYLERDARQQQQIRDMRAFEHFVAMACALHAREFNSAAFSRQTGITLPTSKSWAGILEASYLSFMLPPYFKSFGKRLTKAPKLYMTDPAIACYLTRQPNAEAALAGAMGPALFEGLIAAEAVKAFHSIGQKPALWYWRSHDGLEIDLIIQAGGRIIPVEIKLTTTPGSGHTENLKRLRKLAGEDFCEPGIVACRVPQQQPLGHGIEALPWWEFPAWIARKLT